MTPGRRADSVILIHVMYHSTSGEEGKTVQDTGKRPLHAPDPSGDHRRGSVCGIQRLAAPANNDASPSPQFDLCALRSIVAFAETIQG